MKFLKIIAVNLAAITLVLVLLFTIISLVLNYTTRHGESLTVPDITGMQLEEAEKMLTDKQLRYVITDSLFFEDKPKMSVLDQNPSAQSKVKEGRIIYLTINCSNAPLITMPNLIDVSLRQAQVVLLGVGLKTGQLIYKPDIAENVVIEQSYNGHNIKPGAKVPKGSVIDITLGNGLGTEADVPLPDLSGLTLHEAGNLLNSSSLTLGSAIYQGRITDTLSARVFRQVPPYEAGLTVKSSQAIDVYLKQE